MKLSEAIRLGAMLKPQAFNSGRHQGSCALRAAAEAMGFPDTVYLASRLLPYGALYKRWPFLGLQMMACPDCGKCCDMMWIIGHLNDIHKWTRETIADWVATVEPADPDAATSLDVDSHPSSVDAVVPGV